MVPAFANSAMSGAAREVVNRGPVEIIQDVWKAVVDEAESHITIKLQDVWDRAATQAKENHQHTTRKLNQLLQQAQELSSAQESMQAENCALLAMVQNLLAQIPVPGDRQSQDVVYNAGSATPSTCATPRDHEARHPLIDLSSSPNPKGIGQHDVEMLSLSDALLGQIPPFPTALPMCHSAPVSLADALGIWSCTPAPTLDPEGKCKTSSGDEEDAFVFRITLRVADAVDLGLSFVIDGKVLRIESVLPGTAAEAWNKQCSTSGSPDRVLRVGDHVAAVNDCLDPEIMMAQCRCTKLLKLLVLRRQQTSSQTTPMPGCADSDALPTLWEHWAPSGPPGLEPVTLPYPMERHLDWAACRPWP
mmetsp:Transcript_42307/g.78783  ORF Transcript_42307/g.78783 Transcript_42307/m.78783 type:complete len:361 (+) Transcript_42307:99-1181(+)